MSPPVLEMCTNHSTLSSPETVIGIGAQAPPSDAVAIVSVALPHLQSLHLVAVQPDRAAPPSSWVTVREQRDHMQMAGAGQTQVGFDDSGRSLEEEPG